MVDEEETGLEGGADAIMLAIGHLLRVSGASLRSEPRPQSMFAMLVQVAGFLMKDIEHRCCGKLFAIAKFTIATIILRA